MNQENNQLKEILEYIPSGAQTLSKYPGQFVVGVTPSALARGEGAYVWDSEGKKYLDLISALGSLVFGYKFQRIDEAVKKQIDKGEIFSLASDQELVLAKLIREVIPCGEMSRFALNGNDVTSGAIRLARHITKRDHVAKCGYHGWQDWSIGTKPGRNNGVPEIVKTLTHDFVYNNPESLEDIFTKYPDQIAAVILEPTSAEAPQDDFLKKVKEIAHRHGAILIFDEMVTGFRWALGGAQEYFKVTPDLACFGKGISNGYPVSVLCGKKDYMQKLDEVFVSVNFGGFTLGLVAAIETINLMKELGDVQGHLHEIGDYFIEGGNARAKKYNAPVSFVGYGPHPVMKIDIQDDYQSRIVKTYIYQEMTRAGILFSSSLMMNYLLTKKEIDYVLDVLESIVKEVGGISGYNELESKIVGKIVEPRTVRNIQ